MARSTSRMMALCRYHGFGSSWGLVGDLLLSLCATCELQVAEGARAVETI